MNVLIKSVKIIDPRSKHHNKIKDILIKDGKIQKISSKIKDLKSKKITVFTGKNLHLSPGWFDMHANFCDPGNEQSETLYSGCNSALKGGFTGVQIMPNTNPCIDNRGQVEYIINKTKENIIDVIPAGNITTKQEGCKIVEMKDMVDAGCKAFTDDKKTIQNNEVLKIALLYAKDTEALIMSFPNDNDISKNGQMHEGITSTYLGLKGIPSLAEYITVNRDINLSRYTDCHLHLSYISTKESVQRINEAKKKKIKITADVAIHNLFLKDDSVNNFDTRYKVKPPLREESDIKRLIKGLKDGSIDVICTDHTPIDSENKKIEFDIAQFGIIGLETAFGLIGKYLAKHLTITEIVEKIAINPRKILKLDEHIIEEGMLANITFFDPNKSWIYNIEDIVSKSNNTPFIGEKLKGKALAIYNKGKFKLC